MTEIKYTHAQTIQRRKMKVNCYQQTRNQQNTSIPRDDSRKQPCLIKRFNEYLL
jgi:hypothetical protein